MSHEQQIERGIELLELCQQLQSEKDGVDRPQLGVIDKRKTLDSFAMDISQAAMNMSALYKLYPMMNRLAEIGRKLEKAGLIQPQIGDSYAEKALDYLEHHANELVK